MILGAETAIFCDLEAFPGVCRRPRTFGYQRHSVRALAIAPYNLGLQSSGNVGTNERPSENVVESGVAGQAASARGAGEAMVAEMVHWSPTRNTIQPFRNFTLFSGTPPTNCDLTFSLVLLRTDERVEDAGDIILEDDLGVSGAGPGVAGGAPGLARYDDGIVGTVISSSKFSNDSVYAAINIAIRSVTETADREPSASVPHCLQCILSLDSNSMRPRAVTIKGILLRSNATRRLLQHAHCAPPLCSRDYPTKLTPAHNYPQYGKAIHESLASLWLPILKKGLQKENKEKLIKNYLIPDNCRFLQSPKLNAEISAAVSEIVRGRDKKLAGFQQQLGAGITAINKGIETVLSSDNKAQALTFLSDSCRILTDLHWASTRDRIKLITPSLEKNILHIIQDSERDDTLFGNSLSDKIKASKAIHRQGQQIKNKTAGKLERSTSLSDQQRWTRQPHEAISNEATLQSQLQHDDSEARLSVQATCTNTTITQVHSACPAAQYGWLYTKILERQKFLALQKYNDNFEAKISLPDTIRADLNWWIKNIATTFSPMRTDNRADEESRKINPDTEWELSDEAYATILKNFGQPNLDLFASRANAKCDAFVSWRQEPDATAIDAFTLNWNSYSFYAFPPFSLVLKCLRKIEDDEATGILVFPYWPSQPWFPLLTKLLVSEGPSSPTCQPYPGCRDALRAAFIRRGSPPETVPLMLASLADTTVKQYNVSIKLWWEYCTIKNIDATCLSKPAVMSFLTEQFNKGCSYGTLNSHRSALSLLLGSEIGADDCIKRLLKGAFKLKPRPYKPASSQTLSRWIKQVLIDSGVDVTVYGAHSTRHAATSAANAAGISLDTIRKAAGWSSSSNRGVRQGDVISPKLFTAALEDAFKILNWEGQGININGEYFNHLRFADDIVVMAERPWRTSVLCSPTSAVSDRVGLKINIDKTERWRGGAARRGAEALPVVIFEHKVDSTHVRGHICGKTCGSGKIEGTRALGRSPMRHQVKTALNGPLYECLRRYWRNGDGL
ncbi:hypothetical protein MSG28_005035 [Choristoneura fumiferana]|uniref:Uncharacterized protein n=1 Tax=Choristoneura fumiferana TaxID=7141 RepID=A0ACC0JPH3_CHOFU|nr:hypothetical protein MSG28_005035 [Choristoneura fumiferana]